MNVEHANTIFDLKFTYVPIFSVMNNEETICFLFHFCLGLLDGIVFLIAVSPISFPILILRILRYFSTLRGYVNFERSLTKFDENFWTEGESGGQKSFFLRTFFKNPKV